MRTVHVEKSATAGELFDQAAGEPVLLRVPSGRAFVLVEVDRDDVETLTLADNAKFNDILNRSRARARREGWLRMQNVRARVGGM